jgi:hypothetical protein
VQSLCKEFRELGSEREGENVEVDSGLVQAGSQE